MQLVVLTTIILLRLRHFLLTLHHCEPVLSKLARHAEERHAVFIKNMLTLAGGHWCATCHHALNVAVPVDRMLLAEGC
jgi:hypothetical protein